jgi:hypothetical protein
MTDLTLKPTFIDHGGSQVYNVIGPAWNYVEDRPLPDDEVIGQTRLAPDPRIREQEIEYLELDAKTANRIKELEAEILSQQRINHDLRCKRYNLEARLDEVSALIDGVEHSDSIGVRWIRAILEKKL